MVLDPPCKPDARRSCAAGAAKLLQSMIGSRALPIYQISASAHHKDPFITSTSRPKSLRDAPAWLQILEHVPVPPAYTPKMQGLSRSCHSETSRPRNVVIPMSPQEHVKQVGLCPLTPVSPKAPSSSICCDMETHSRERERERLDRYIYIYTHAPFLQIQRKVKMQVQVKIQI